MSVPDHIAKLKIELSDKSDDELIIIKQLGVDTIHQDNYFKSMAAEQILQERKSVIENKRHDEALEAAALANRIARDAKIWAIIAAIIATIAIIVAK